jgi:hypothetical protein
MREVIVLDAQDRNLSRHAMLKNIELLIAYKILILIIPAISEHFPADICKNMRHGR